MSARREITDIRVGHAKPYQVLPEIAPVIRRPLFRIAGTVSHVETSKKLGEGRERETEHDRRVREVAEYVARVSAELNRRLA